MLFSSAKTPQKKLDGILRDLVFYLLEITPVKIFSLHKLAKVGWKKIPSASNWPNLHFPILYRPKKILNLGQGAGPPQSWEFFFPLQGIELKLDWLTKNSHFKKIRKFWTFSQIQDGRHRKGCLIDQMYICLLYSVFAYLPWS